MKKLMSVLFLSMLIFLLIGCQKKLKGMEGLIEKAGEEISVAEADAIEIKYAGSCIKDETALLWFVSGNEYPYSYYNELLPSQYQFLDKDGNELGYQ